MFHSIKIDLQIVAVTTENFISPVESRMADLLSVAAGSELAEN